MADPDELVDFERWAEEAGYPLTHNPGELAHQPFDPDDIDSSFWVYLGGLPMSDFIPPRQPEQGNTE